MNGELEALLFGNHFFYLEDDPAGLAVPIADENVRNLREHIHAVLILQEQNSPELN